MPTVFKLIRFNQIRAGRGAPAAEVEITSEDHQVTLWMSLNDIRKNLMASSTEDDVSGLGHAEAAYSRCAMGGDCVSDPTRL